MNKIIEREEVNVKDMIYEIRGKYVMVDRDLANLYHTETRILNQKVKRNIERFPENYCFQMNEEEFWNWKSQNVTSNNDKIGLRRPPYVFTEQGVAMLSAIINTKIAVKISIKIINAFVDMKKIISSNLISQDYYNKMTIRHDDEIKLLQESLNELNVRKEYDGIFFDGQVYDSYSLMLDIFSKAKNNIVIIDNYIDKKILDILRNIDIDILIITNKYKTCDYNKYKSQYSNIKLKINNNIHDRFIIIDDKELYHCGASFKDLGKKCFGINRIESKEWLNKIMNFVGGI